MKITDIVSKVVDLGVGEIILNSIDKEGTYSGYDFEAFKQINDMVDLPIILSCGCGDKNDMLLAFKQDVEAVCAGSIFYWIGESIISIKEFLNNNKINVRLY